MDNFDINKIKRHNLNRLLNEKGIKAVKLASLMGVDTSYISRLRSGSVNIGDKTLIKICKALNVSKREFFEHNVTTVDESITHSVTDEEAKYEAEHHRLILKFINKKWGLDTNRILLEIERLDPSLLNTTQNLLKALVDTLKKEKRNE